MRLPSFLVTDVETLLLVPPNNMAVYLQRVFEGFRADLMGLHIGDIIIDYDKDQEKWKFLDDPNDASTLLQQGDSFTLTILRFMQTASTTDTATDGDTPSSPPRESPKGRPIIARKELIPFRGFVGASGDCHKKFRPDIGNSRRRHPRFRYEHGDTPAYQTRIGKVPKLKRESRQR